MTCRRTFLKSSLAAAGYGWSLQCRAEDSAAGRVELAHREIWRRFVDKHDVMIDFTMLDGSVSIPSPEECQQGKPNALGWWSPIENGSMFNGLYMDGAVNRWRVTRKQEDADKARRLARGLMFLSSISAVKGFVARGVATDGKSHYPMGSNDQTLPWFLGLWRYLDAGLASPEERQQIISRMVETAEVIISLKWQMPAEQPFGIRGGFGWFGFDSAPRLLFVVKALHHLTGDQKWDALYREALTARGGPDKKSRLEICEHGMVFEHGGRHSWTSSCCVASIRALWEMEKDPAVRDAYARGLEASAVLAMESLPLAQQFKHEDPRPFDADWRKLNATWVPQATEKDAQALAEAQSKDLNKMAPRRPMEFNAVREPVFAAWIVTLATDQALLKQRRAQVEAVLGHYHCDQLYYSQFFPIESAWWRLQLAR